MSKYRTKEGIIVDTEKNTAKWTGKHGFDGSNAFDVNTGSQWEGQNLYRSAKARYYLEHWSARQGAADTAEFVTDEEAAGWLILNDHPLPADLQHLEDDISE